MSYTTQAKVELILSAESEADIVEDLSSGNQATLWDSILAETDAIFNLHLCDLYEASDLAINNWVIERAKWVAAYLITRRRGNPGYYQGMYEETLEMLRSIRKGEMRLPANDGSMLAMTSANLPAIINPVFDDRFRVTPLRHDALTAVGETSGSNLIPSWERWYDGW